MKGVLEDEAYSYDPVGNRLTDIEARSYTYNNGNELLTQNSTSFTFDANGNMTSKTDSSGTTSYVYNSENRLVQLTTPNSQLVTYKYDPFGRRIQKSITDTNNNITIKKYVYDREDILFELDGSGNVVIEYVHGPGIDEPIAMIRNNQTYYYHADGLGSIIAITNSAGNVVQRYEYNSFGEITYQQDPNFIQPYTYTGREYDEESGLYYYRARYYDPKIGRFITQDPIGFSGGINFYSYVGNNPISMIDPYGLYVGGIGGFVSGGISGNVSPGIFGAGSASLVWDQYGNFGIAFCGSTGIAAGGGLIGGGSVTNAWGANSICDLAGSGVGVGAGGAVGVGGFAEVSSGGIATGVGVVTV